MSDVRYPLSTANGIPVPLEILRPVGILPINFLLASGSAGLEIAEAIEIMMVLCDEDCFLEFFASATAASAIVNAAVKNDAIWIPKNMMVTISPPVDKRFLSVRGDSANGRLICNLIGKWSALATKAQLERGGR